MDLSLFGNVTSIVGFIVSIAVAYVQASNARAANARAVTLEHHLERQRWQQLRSIAEIIDLLEKDGRHTHNADYAAARASLRQQYAATLATLTASETGFSPTVIRHWIEVGRLTRPWQIVEAMTHLRNGQQTACEDDFKWVNEKLAGKAPSTNVEALQTPPILNRTVAAHILCAYDRRELIRAQLRVAYYNRYPLLVMLSMMAHDRCLGPGNTTTPSCWGLRAGKDIDAIFAHYAKHDFSMLFAAAQGVAQGLAPFAEYFEDASFLEPREVAVERARNGFADLIAAVQ